MSKSYMGIDPGAKGFIAIQADGEFEHYPLAGLDLYEMADLFTGIKARHPNIVCVIEDVRAIHGSASTATFSFGMNKGALLAFLCAYRIPYEQVLPQVWQRAMWTNSDTVTKKAGAAEGKRKAIDTKATSTNAAKRIFPWLDYRKSDKSRVIDDNKVDATLLSEYARRRNL